MYTMSVLDKINEIESRINELQEANSQATKRMQAESDLIDKNDAKIETLRDSIALVKEYAEEVEIDRSKEREAHNEAFRVLRNAIASGVASGDDCDKYAEVCGLSQPEAEEEGVEESIPIHEIAS
jgi:chromosome segregation ATPase